MPAKTKKEESLRDTQVIDRAESRDDAKTQKGDYMVNVGKAGIKYQQSHMSETADNETARLARQKKVSGKYKGAK